MCVSPRKPSCDILALHVAMLFFARNTFELIKKKSTLEIGWIKNTFLHSVLNLVSPRLCTI